MRYVDKLSLETKDIKKEPIELDFLQKLESEYGKDFRGDGFAVEKFTPHQNSSENSEKKLPL